MRIRLVDTGPLVAYLDARDPSHAPVAESLERYSGGIATTSAVVTESMHFLRRLDQVRDGWPTSWRKPTPKCSTSHGPRTSSRPWA